MPQIAEAGLRHCEDLIRRLEGDVSDLISLVFRLKSSGEDAAFFESSLHTKQHELDQWRSVALQLQIQLSRGGETDARQFIGVEASSETPIGSA